MTNNHSKNKDLIVGLDIGTSKVVCLVGRYDSSENLEVLSLGTYPSSGLKKGVVVNIDATTDAIEKAVEQAQSLIDEKIKNIFVGIAGNHVKSLNSEGVVGIKDKEVKQSDVDAVIESARAVAVPSDQTMLHVIPQEYTIDEQDSIKEPIGMHGGRLEANFHVVVGQVTSIKNIGRCIKSAGLVMAGITLEPLASSEAVLSFEEKEAGVALIDIGGGTTDLAIFKDGIIRHTAVIPYGGNVITEDIKEGCSIIEKQAELLKIKFGSAWPGENRDTEIVSIPGLQGRDPKEISLKTLSKIINARVVEIIEQVFLEIKNYGHTDQKKKLIAGIVLTGGGSQLKHLKQLVEYVTGMDTRVGYPSEHLAGNTIDSVSSPLFATSVGLLMNALDEISPGNIDNYDQGKTPNLENDQTDNKFSKKRKSILDRFGEKLKEFLDNA